jgi:hypothetical protein
MPCKIHQLFISPALYATLPLSGNAAESDARLQRLTVDMVETFIRDLKEAIWEAKGTSAGKGTMVSLYGKCDKCGHRAVVRIRPLIVLPTNL